MNYDEMLDNQILMSPFQDRFKTVIAPLVVGIATSGLIFEHLYFLPSIHSDSRRMFLDALADFTYVMCFISYYYAIKIKNTLPDSILMPRIKSQLKYNHPAYTERRQCEKDNMRYKPFRTSHCHNCGCVAKMDHHCPYTNNCVGAKNFKAFILFCGYGGIFALEFFCLSIMYYGKIGDKDPKAAVFSEGGIFIWMFLSFMSFMLVFSMVGLAVSNFLMAGKNLTQLDMMKGQFMWIDKHNLHPNPFDLGYLTNWNVVFAGDYWLFWWPTEIINDNDHTDFPMRPPVSKEDFQELPKKAQDDLQDPFIKTIPKTIEQLREKEEKNYEKVIFFYLGQQYRLRSDEIRSQLEEIKKISAADLNEDQDDDVEGNEQSGNEKGKVKVNNEEDAEILKNLYDD